VSPIDLDERPMLVFWETTKACLLRCRHWRASAVDHPLPG
jgi:MoaA/NifB/PqqE/SkfB family radical SAM enzyme